MGRYVKDDSLIDFPALLTYQCYRKTTVKTKNFHLKTYKGKNLNNKIIIRMLPTTLLQIFCRVITFKVIIKSIKNPETNNNF